LATVNLNGIKIKRATRTQLNSAKTNSTLIPYTFVFITDESKLAFVKAINDYIDIGATSGGTSNVIAIDVSDQLDNLYYETSFEDGNWFLIEDSEDGYAKKKVKISTLRDYDVVDEVTGDGYVAGGENGTRQSSIEKINFPNLTRSVSSATLAQARYGMQGVHNILRGYFGGGYTTGVVSEIDGVIYSTDASNNVSAVLAVARHYIVGGFNSDTRGYFCGGYVASNDVRAEIDGIRFDTEAAINPSAALALARFSGCDNGNEFRGYCSGGHDGTSTTEVDGMRYDTEAAINPSSVLSVARYGLSGLNASDYGYRCGGGKNTNPHTNTIDGIKFSDETSVTVTATLSDNINGQTGVSCETYGLSCGGHNGTSYLTLVHKLNFSDLSISNGYVALGTTRRFAAGVQSGGVY
jgi:hypothetical protein